MTREYLSEVSNGHFANEKEVRKATNKPLFF